MQIQAPMSPYARYMADILAEDRARAEREAVFALLQQFQKKAAA